MEGVKGKKGKFHPKEVMKVQRVSSNIALHFLYLRRYMVCVNKVTPPPLYFSGRLGCP